MSEVLDAVRRRRSHPKVSDRAPSREELLPLIEAAARVADHSSLRPWRLIELRDADLMRLGLAIHRVLGKPGASSKPTRAPLLIAVVASRKPSHKVPEWEQDATAAGVAHALSLLLDDAGWGVIWRTGEYTRAPEIAALHGLGDHEELLGWLYVGGKTDLVRLPPREGIDPGAFLTRLPPRASAPLM